MDSSGTAWAPLSDSDLDRLFVDITPITPYGGPIDVVRIDYPPGFARAAGLLAALRRNHGLASQRQGLESVNRGLDSRALALAGAAIGHNGADYTAWAHRRAVLSHGLESVTNQGLESVTNQGLESILDAERAWADDFGAASPKNYQLWNHLRWLARRGVQPGTHGFDPGTLSVPSLQSELRRSGRHMTAGADADAKNYHAWAHRQWALSAAAPGLSRAESLITRDAELAFCAGCLAADGRNNSAWSHRAFLRRLFPPGGDAGDSDAGESESRDFESEVALTLACLAACPDNAPAWAYLRGLFAPSATVGLPATVRLPARGRPLSSSARVFRFAAAATKQSPPVPAAIEWLADAAVEAGRSVHAAELFGLLGVMDPMRGAYWGHRAAAAAAGPAPA